MKRKTDSELQGLKVGYEFPFIATIEVASEQILCTSGWNDGSVDDDDDNWNRLPSL